MKAIQILFLILGMTKLGMTQTGPAGVGTIDGTSSLEMWLEANDLDGDNDFTNNPANGTSVSSWVDKSGNSNDLTQSGANRPVYATGTFNAVNFDATATTVQYLSSSSSGAYSDGSVFIATNVIDEGIFSVSFFNNSDYSLRADQFNKTGFVGFTRFGLADFASTIPSVFATNSIYSYHKTGASASIDLRINGSTQNLGIGSSAYGIPYDRFGQTGAGGRASGDIYEILLYSSRLNTLEILLVENYLSAKYGGITIPTDLYDEDEAANGNYDYDVAGIGQASDGSNNTNAQGTGIVSMLNASNLNNDEFLIWGHDNGTDQADEISDVPASVEARFERVWRVSEVNSSSSAVDVGSVDIRFDLTGKGSITASDLRLLVDTDNDGVFNDETPISGATNVSGDIYQFAGVTAIANNLRFTLATIDTLQTPLPIELVYFNLSSENNRTVYLEWQTASEINNDYFTIERSLNRFFWETVGTVDGAGNSNTFLTYAMVDYTPYSGVSYYRLKQTDFDGQFDYSQIKSVTINSASGAAVDIFPNPTENQITIIGSRLDLEHLKVFNTFSQDVTTLTTITENTESEFVIDLSQLSDGIYYIKTRTTTSKVCKR